MDQVPCGVEIPLNCVDASHSVPFCLEPALLPIMEELSNANIIKHNSRFYSVAT